MTDEPDTSISVGGDLSGQAAIGSHISQTRVELSSTPPTSAELDQLHRQFAATRDTVASEAPPDKQADAVARIDELEQAVTAEQPKLSTMEYVRDWFAEHVPSLLGTVTGLVINPIVGKLVGAAGDAVAGEFRRRFFPPDRA